MSLKDQTIRGIAWSFLDNSFTQVVTFIVGIILARLLTPAEFGLIGMITIFIVVAHSIVDSGFSQALIRKKDCSEDDYNTVFYFNIGVSVFFYMILFASSGLIADFFNQVQLIKILRVLGLVIVINAFGLVQLTQLTKNIEIKVQTKVSFIANTTSGLIAIYMAYTGYGVWSLVWRNLTNTFFRNILFWFYNNWRPKFSFSLLSFKDMFSFGSKLLVSGIINRVFENLYYFIIGKYFSAQDLGYYSRADTFARLPSSNISGVIQKVSYPALAKLQDDANALKSGLKKLIKTTMFITFTLMLLMAAIAKPLILTLIGVKWMQSIPYLQLMCFSLMLFPLHSLNLNLLNIKGRSDLFLKLEILKKIMAIPVIILGIFYGITVMISGAIITSFFAYFLNSFYTEKLINYSILEQIKDILPSLILATLVSVIIYALGEILSLKPVFTLIIQAVTGIFFVISLSELIKLDGYVEIKQIIKNKFIKKY